MKSKWFCYQIYPWSRPDDDIQLYYDELSGYTEVKVSMGHLCMTGTDNFILPASSVGWLQMSQDPLVENKNGMESKWFHLISTTKYILVGLGQMIAPHQNVTNGENTLTVLAQWVGRVRPMLARHTQIHPSSTACRRNVSVPGPAWQEQDWIGI